MNFTLKPYAVFEDETKVFLEETAENVFEGDGVTLKLTYVGKNGVTAVLADAESKDKAFHRDCAIGLLIEEIEGMSKYVTGTSPYKDCICWYAPLFGTDLKKVDAITQYMLWKYKDNSFGFMATCCNDNYKSELAGDENGLNIQIYNWDKGHKTVNAIALLTADGDVPYELSENCVKFGMELTGLGVGWRGNRKFPEILEYLGWCTWDALQIRVSEDGICEKLDEFKEKDIPVKWLIIDDMWADCTNLDTGKYSNFTEMMEMMRASKLNAFEASPKRFPKGLKHCIQRIKKDYGKVVGMWHPITGYWLGVTEGTPLFEEYKDCLFKNPEGWYQPAFEKEKAFKFYDAWHSFFKDCGAEFVKVDYQSSFHFNKDVAPVGTMARNLHYALDKSANKNFSGTLINCMDTAAENMWNRPETAITRCSDDFMPENRPWFKKHILQCTYNSLYMGMFLHCDYDMWWTDDGQGRKNSLLRAVSGGPVYVSDQIGRSVKELIMPLVLNDGKILRCDRPGMPTIDCLVDDPTNIETPFKVQNICGTSGVIAAFNLCNDENAVAKGTVSPSEVYGLCGEEFALYEHFSGEYKILKKDEIFDFELNGNDEFKLFVIVPINNGFAPIGLVDKYISPKTIKSVNGTDIELFEGGKFAYIKDGKFNIVDADTKVSC